MAKRFERQLDAATEQTLVEPNWEGILECVDMIRGSEVPVKDALVAIQRRIHSANPHVAHHGLLVLEACMKNCGKKFHAEVASREFMDDMRSMIIGGDKPDKVRDKLLELIQCWSAAFRTRGADYKFIVDTHQLLKMQGFNFPAMKEADAMFSADSAPEWAEGENCYRCRTAFGMFTRKHHCRACGQIFCDSCSRRQMLLPQFGIEKMVRVCENCFEKRGGGAGASSQAKTSSSAASGGTNGMGESGKQQDDEAARERARRDLEAKEEEELQLALAISQSEAEEKERQQKSGGGYSSYYSATQQQSSAAAATNARQTANLVDDFYRAEISPSPHRKDSGSYVDPTHQQRQQEDSASGPVDAVLAKYLDRDYWEKRRAGGGGNMETASTIGSITPSDLKGLVGGNYKATAPPPSEFSTNSSGANTVHLHQQQQGGPNEQQPSNIAENRHSSNSMNSINTMVQVGGGEQPSSDETEDTRSFCRALHDKVDVMAMRMRSNQLRGRSIINDSSIHSLFAQLSEHHGQVLARMSRLESEREYYESLQDHLAHLNEARQAVNALREEHSRQVQERLKEEQRQRQLQMQQKVEVMRHKRHEMLLFQRHAALQRFQEHEQQVQQRKQQQQMHGGMPAAGSPGMMMPQQPQGAYPTPAGYQSPALTTANIPMGQHGVPQQHLSQHQWVNYQPGGGGGGAPGGSNIDEIPGGGYPMAPTGAQDVSQQQYQQHQQYHHQPMQAAAGYYGGPQRQHALSQGTPIQHHPQQWVGGGGGGNGHPHQQHYPPSPTTYGPPHHQQQPGGGYAHAPATNYQQALLPPNHQVYAYSQQHHGGMVVPGQGYAYPPSDGQPGSATAAASSAGIPPAQAAPPREEVKEDLLISFD